MTEVALRVLTWDLGCCARAPAAVAEVLRRLDPDVVCLQRAPRLFRWRSRCASLARQAGLLVAAGGPTAGANVVLVSMRVGAAPKLGRAAEGSATAVAAAEVAGVAFVVGCTRTRHNGPDTVGESAQSLLQLGRFGGDHQILCRNPDGTPETAIFVSTGVKVLDRRCGSPAGTRTRRRQPVVADLLLPRLAVTR